MSVIFATLCQPLFFLRSQRSFITTTISTTSGHFHLGVTPNCMIQTRGLHFTRSLKTINRQYQSATPGLRGVLFSLKRPTVHSLYRNIREFALCSDTRKNLRFPLVANMSTRRSARLIAASESKASSSPSPATALPPPSAPAQKGRKRKAATDTVPNGVTEDAPAKAPTVSKKRRTQRPSTPPPPSSTPTPSNVKLMAEPAAPGDAVFATPPSKKPRAAAVDRLADSNTTLATLLSPETSRIVTSKKARTRSPSGSPTKQPVQKTPATASILEEANRFLVSVDPRMRPLVENHHCRIFSPEGLAEEIDPFESLCSGIISQQVSGAAAKSIKNKFIGLFHEGLDGEESSAGGDGSEEQAKERRFPHPSEVVKVPLEKLRTAGLSQRKAEYVSGLAEKFVSGELSAEILANAPYEEVISRLTAVRGLGLWSAEMFACFGLKRTDVFSLGDLGVQRGMAAFVGRDIAKLKSKGGKFKYMSEADMTALSDKFKPYRSLFMWYMWRVEETDVSTME
ncbi:DNA glycosylase [Xylaria scruposa]|nr:DNA glycosylase [Xylaria scruposa]